ncbi:hypothetical protein Q8F55_000100 [Vanrija albida]|uniref:F-box domain-containing protein n=1 Tax=Vanrija albida TaxID=181172 RepID=A0ABR3QCB2_9TREE
MALSRLSMFSVRSAATTSAPSPTITSPTASTAPSTDSGSAPAIPRLDLKVSEPFPGTEWPDDALAAQRRLTAVASVDAAPIWVQLLGAPWVVGRARGKNGRVVRRISGQGVRGHDLIRLALQLSNTHITRLTYCAWSASPAAADELIMRTLGRLTSLRTLNIRHAGPQRTALPVPVLIALLQALPHLEVLTLECGSEAFSDPRFLAALQDRSVRLQRLECGAYHATSAWSISLECEECWKRAGPRTLDKVKLALDRNRERRRRERRAALRVLVVARVLIHARPEPGVEMLRVPSGLRASVTPQMVRTSRSRDTLLLPPSPAPSREMLLLPPSPSGRNRGSATSSVSHSKKPRRMSLLSLPPVHSPFVDADRQVMSAPSSPVACQAPLPTLQPPPLRKSKSSIGFKVSSAFNKVKTLVTRAPKAEPIPTPASSREDSPLAPSSLLRLPASVRFRIARHVADVSHLDAGRLTRLSRYAADRTSLGRIAHAVGHAAEWEVPEAQIRDDWLACGGF